MPLSHCEEYSCEYKNLKFATNSPKIIRLVWRNTEGIEALRMFAKFLRILANFCESITNKANGLRFCLYCLENALRMRANGLPTFASYANA